jgi:hypothetical protein
MRCGHIVESCSFEVLQDALTATISSTGQEILMKLHDGSPLEPLLAFLSIWKLIKWVFAVLVFCKQAWNTLLSPYLLSSLLGMCAKIFISFLDVPVNGNRRSLYGRIIAVMNDCPRHSAEYRLDHV